LAEKTLQFLAITEDPTISHVLEGMAHTYGWGLVVFRTAAAIFSSTVGEVHLLLLDEAVIGPTYLPIVRRARRRYPAVDITVVGGPKSEEVRAADKREGVDYYIERPTDPGGLGAAIEHRRKIAEIKSVVGIVGRSLLIEDIIEAILQVAPTEVPILIEGESGTGKDMIARAVHYASRRRNQPYVAINCAALAEGVLESELFGHEKGAFTGAIGQRSGVFERADKGTIFLDEVGEMSANMQVRLLRVLESGEITRVGGVRSFHVDVRVVAATNRSLGTAVREGRFRQDLYYRLKGVSFYLPALRERKEDIPILIDYFVREANRRHEKDVRGLEKDAVRKLISYAWPGNVRELRNVIDTAVVLASEGRITEGLVDSQVSEGPMAAGTLLPVPLHRTKEEAEREMIYASILAMHRDVREVLSLLRQGVGIKPLDTMKEVFPDGPGDRLEVQTLSNLERSAMREALRATEGNRRRAAELLGISERTLYRKIREYGLL
jgi:DNA-binding NtrC family response regulator